MKTFPIAFLAIKKHHGGKPESDRLCVHPALLLFMQQVYTSSLFCTWRQGQCPWQKTWARSDLFSAITGQGRYAAALDWVKSRKHREKSSQCMEKNQDMALLILIPLCPVTWVAYAGNNFNLQLSGLRQLPYRSALVYYTQAPGSS